MKFRTYLGPAFWIAIGFALSLSSSGCSDGAVGPGTVGVAPVLSTPLAETPDRHATMVVVTLDPGAASPPHRHPGTVIVYVLEGEVESALDDEAPQTYSAGAAWKEHPGALHRVAKNNTKKVTKLLAVLVHGEGDELQLPAE